MARKTNFQRLLDDLFSQIGSEVARGVADGLARSGLMKNIQALSRGMKKNRPAKETGQTRKKSGRPKSKAKTCSVKGCTKPARAKGLCSKHYQQKRYSQLKKKPAAKKVAKKKVAKRKSKKSKPAKAPRTGAKTCQVKGCNKKVYARGMCGQHFMAWVRTKKK